jgi:cobalt-zinc-cadmium resistance protein CzcA
VNASGGSAGARRRAVRIRSEGLFTSVEDLKAVRLATRRATPVFLKDVATGDRGMVAPPGRGQPQRGDGHRAGRGAHAPR